MGVLCGRIIDPAMTRRSFVAEMLKSGIACSLPGREREGSLGDKMPDTMGAHYLGYLVRVVNRAAGGYILLRENFHVDASKFLVRPALEAIFIVKAVMNASI